MYKSLHFIIKNYISETKIWKDTYIAFLALKKEYDSVPIYNVLMKIYHFGIRGKCYKFI